MAEEAAHKPGSTRALVALLAFVLGFATVPHRVMERDAAKWFEGDAAQTDLLAAGVARWTESPDALAPATFATGSSRFDGEWLFATFMMSAMGFGQVATARTGAARDESVARMERCLDALLEPRVRTFEDQAWGNDALASLDATPGSAEDRGHVAYLGYAGLALSLHRTLRPASRFVAREEAIARAIARRIEASPTGFVETYPGEVYPVDNTAALAALALHARATGEPPPPALERGLAAVSRSGVDPATGLLVQAVTVVDASPRDAPRASGTALAAYFLSFADDATSRALFHALEKHQYRTVLGFGGMMEYPPGKRAARGDVDSGPVFLGFGVSASGFALGASRVHGDRETFTALYATAQLFGAPLEQDGTLTYATGGPIGDAILFAMLTAPRRRPS
ncbi:MAG: hypothetical protein KF850_17600 [Labilithrix sp.]|nr:hypothetical protein [Labilithrix sp.]